MDNADPPQQVAILTGAFVYRCTPQHVYATRVNMRSDGDRCLVYSFLPIHESTHEYS